MTKKKILLTIVAVAVVCAISITGTLAYLTATSNNGQAVQNTFVGSTGLFTEPGFGEDPDPPTPPTDPDDPPTPIDTDKFAFIVAEHRVDWVENTDTGVKTLEFVDAAGAKAEKDAAATVVSNYYKLQPGVNAPKDPFVHIDAGRKTDVGAYLYIKVSGLGNTNVSVAVDENNWQEVTGVEGLAAGEAVYIYQTSDTNPEVISQASMAGVDLNINVLAQGDGKAVTVANLTSDELKAAPKALDHEITVKAYMVQAVELTDTLTAASLFNEAF